MQGIRYSFIVLTVAIVIAALLFVLPIIPVIRTATTECVDGSCSETTYYATFKTIPDLFSNDTTDGNLIELFTRNKKSLLTQPVE